MGKDEAAHRSSSQDIPIELTQTLQTGTLSPPSRPPMRLLVLPTIEIAIDFLRDTCKTNVFIHFTSF